MKIAFVTHCFPAVTETFIIDQVADLLERKVEVDVYAFEKGDEEHVSSRYREHCMDERTRYFQVPKSRWRRLISAPRLALRLLWFQPLTFLRAFNIFKHFKRALSLELLYKIQPLVFEDYNLVHCHFGPAAVSFLELRDVLGWHVPLVTSLYGYDVSTVPRTQRSDYYQRLQSEGALFFVMSENMKRRAVALGFPEEKVVVHPVSIDVEAYPFCARTRKDGEPVQIVAVGRLTEKKGFDDLIRALAVVRSQTGEDFRCSIIGGGPLEPELRRLVIQLRLSEIVSFEGWMSVQCVVNTMLRKHFMVAPSKTAADGDME